MTEDFLQYLWKYKKFGFTNLKTTKHEELILQQVGTHNVENSGPDFFNARLIIQGQKWAGNVEVHIKSSDWYVHNHENDPAYDNVILHVVWEDDVEVYRNDNSIIPTLQLKEYVKEELLVRYKKLFDKNAQQWISCDKQLPEVSDFMLSNWQERLYLERLEKKSTLILELLEDSANNWEAVLFRLLSKNFGLKTNGIAFLSIANSIDFAVLRKCTDHLGQIEALFFGQAGFLEINTEGEYFNTLKKEYRFLKNKFKLNTNGVEPLHFFRLRPSNFPTIRLAQLAMLYFKNHQLFSKVINSNTIDDFYTLFNVETSEFWQNHYTFEKESKTRKKKLTKSFIDLLLINTIIPMKFVYARSMGQNPEEDIFELISKLPFEKNSIISNFADLKVPIENAMHSQAMIQLKNTYCDQKACLKCAIGNYLLNGE
ncbi:uncharacterized protein DUF2851 [Aquimarina sp. MAR_2010_214]|uniref:DUF2851 family protein n=1 Tax=Aquimarina sp. MAR_2010_214 TaxID=1250026 RepID=UPI000C70E98B|nr:DUF2851 family protein [Aquimarina sp. MAR_2010_214]PKV49907.1 uncharacterized protein DUF2851 [Aquimarina sp. MAR_2010_214]